MLHYLNPAVSGEIDRGTPLTFVPGLMLAAAPTGIIGDALRPAASAALWIAAILTLWTGADYSLRAAALLQGKRA